jgi:Cu(I)/Ag(I) efflux system periplasmic protein CusF
MKRFYAALLGATVAISALAQAAQTEAEVRKVDKSTGKITLKHGEIRNLDMPAMTMVFGVTDKTMLDKVKAGDKVRFTADKDATGQYIVTGIEAQK